MEDQADGKSWPLARRREINNLSLSRKREEPGQLVCSSASHNYLFVIVHFLLLPFSFRPLPSTRSSIVRCQSNLGNAAITGTFLSADISRAFASSDPRHPMNDDRIKPSS